jgi:Family of unknown function (DUF6318)
MCTPPRYGAALAVIAMLLLGACGDSSNDRPSTLPPRTSVATTAPSESAPALSRIPPEPPPAARKYSITGAAAFIGHYVDTLNYAYETGDTKALERISVPRCQSCRNNRAVIEGTYKNGATFRGGHIRLIAAEPTSADVKENLVVAAAWSSTHREQVASDGAVVGSYPASPQSLGEFTLQWNGTTWLVSEISGRSS